MGGQEASNSKKVLVIGSIGMDQTIFNKQLPRFGEINIGEITKNPGGKGNNEAIACARAGGESTFIGVVGEDYEKILEKTLIDNNISPKLKKLKNINSHTASIIVGENGESKILVSPGADLYLDKNLIDDHMNFIENAYIILLQLEIPFETVKYVIEKCHEKGIKSILRPSPPPEELSDDIIQKVTYLMPNKSELSKISGLPTNDEEQIDKACQNIMNRGAQNLIVPLGTKGCIFWNNKGKKIFNSYMLDEDKVIDTTGSVDCFIGVFAAYLSKKFSEEEAIKYANLAASISVCITGTINSYPKLDDINRKKAKVENW